MTQSKKGSAMEAVANTAIGFLVTWFAGLIIYPLSGIHISVAQNTLVVLLFTVVSLIRGYAVRRCFTKLSIGEGR